MQVRLQCQIIVPDVHLDTTLNDLLCICLSVMFYLYGFSSCVSLWRHGFGFEAYILFGDHARTQ